MYIKRALEADIKKALACFPAILITGARPVVIDEIQKIPELLTPIKSAIRLSWK